MIEGGALKRLAQTLAVERVNLRQAVINTVITVSIWSTANPLYRGIFGSYFNSFNVSSNVTFRNIL